MHHKRSLSGKIKRKTRFLSYLDRKQQKDAIRAEIRSLSRRDMVTGEIAFHPQDRSAIKHTLQSGGCKIETTYTHAPAKRGFEKHVPIKTEAAKQ